MNSKTKEDHETEDGVIRALVFRLNGQEVKEIVRECILKRLNLSDQKLILRREINSVVSFLKIVNTVAIFFRLCDTVGQSPLKP